jgi:hypothetical protein
MHVVSGIAPELLLLAAPAYWSEIEVILEGHMKDALAKLIASLIKVSKSDIRGGMPDSMQPPRSAKR